MAISYNKINTKSNNATKININISLKTNIAKSKIKAEQLKLSEYKSLVLDQWIKQR